jgi:GH18 family chitinase
LGERSKLGRVKVSLGLGDWNEDGGDKAYLRMITSDESRYNFIQSTVELIEKLNFDGLELHFTNKVCLLLTPPSLEYFLFN